MISLQGSCVLRVETRSWFKATSALLEFDTLSPVPQGLLCRCYGFDWLWGHPQVALVSNGTGLKWHWLPTDKGLVMCRACRVVYWAISSNLGFASAAVDKSAKAVVGW